MKYICECCGKEKEDWPAIAYNSPSPYMDLTDDKLDSAELDSDLCVIKYDDVTCYFVRAVLVQSVIDNCQNLEYGIWVSLSEKNFNEYVENYNNKDFEAVYFGWLANHVPNYDYDSIPTNVEVDNKIGRPFICPHESHDHPFINDFYSGISKEEAENRINLVLNRL